LGVFYFTIFVLMVSINNVRETVLAICNKNNYGYISPDDFNLYAKQAQLEIFSSYMERYNYYINLENQHTSGSDLADLAESARESIETFITAEILAHVAVAGIFSTFTAPSDWYHINMVLYNPTANANTEVVKASRKEVISLAKSNLTSPSTTYPYYVVGVGNTIGIAPSSITTNISCLYVRYPVDPVWGYVTLLDGEPVEDVGSSVNFEVSEDEESALVEKILEKAGLSIREPEVYNTAQANDNQQR
jgi:hypothetical protein